MTDALMTLGEVAAYLRLSKDTVYRMAQAGRIPASKVGIQWRFRKAELDAWISTNRNMPAPSKEPRGSGRLGVGRSGGQGGWTDQGARSKGKALRRARTDA